ncbi:hypothetical protein FKP32DRAFT_1682281 [Trametes sanguinea]|nr:hypothetical protein FKP32DRAFT_1682281 [Trametes sanguinea]
MPVIDALNVILDMCSERTSGGDVAVERHQFHQPSRITTRIDPGSGLEAQQGSTRPSYGARRAAFITVVR